MNKCTQNDHTNLVDHDRVADLQNAAILSKPASPFCVEYKNNIDYLKFVLPAMQS